ncbi:unnamed protein product [Auanema sp. JU1783]|nr:unnamed protein product [Auanema sp. JU1783]
MTAESSQSNKIHPLEIAQTTKIKHRNADGMHWFVAAIFIVGDMLGAGMIALPVALGHTGLYMGISLILLASLFSGVTGLQLGYSWAMMQVRWPQYQEHCRRPYPEIAYRALGRSARTFVSIIVCVTQFGLITVLTILAAKNLSNFLLAIFDVHLHFCFIVVFLGIFISPFCMLRSPKDFWLAAFCSAISSITAATIIVVGSFHDSPACSSHAEHESFNLKNMLLGYGTIVFAYGGHAAFPTIQHDMIKPFRFNRSMIFSYAILTVVYLLVGISGYFVYGNSMRDTIVPSLQVTWMSQAVNIMITLHVLPTIIIIFSPIAQQFEDWTRVPHDFSYKRVLARSFILCMVVFVGLSIPDFGVFLDLVGATTMSLMSMILPSIFFLYLKASQIKREALLKEKKLSLDAPDDCRATIKDIMKYIPKSLLILSVISLAFGIIGGLAGTVAALTTLLTSSEVATPCYITWFREGISFERTIAGAVNCCGGFRNVTVFGYDPAGYCSI